MRFAKFSVPAGLHARKDVRGTEGERQASTASAAADDDAVSIHSRLLDKLQLQDDEWDYEEDPPRGFTKGTVHTVRSEKRSRAQVSNAVPASQFRSLQAKRGVPRPNVISRALEDADVTVSSVEHNKSVFVSRHSVQSIHLADTDETRSDESVSDSDSGSDVIVGNVLQTPTRDTFEVTPVGSPLGSTSTSLLATPVHLAPPTLYSPVRNPSASSHIHSDSINSNASAATAPLQKVPLSHGSWEDHGDLERSASLPHVIHPQRPSKQPRQYSPAPTGSPMGHHSRPSQQNGSHGPSPKLAQQPFFHQPHQYFPGQYPGHYSNQYTNLHPGFYQGHQPGPYPGQYQYHQGQYHQGQHHQGQYQQYPQYQHVQYQQQPYPPSATYAPPPRPAPPNAPRRRHYDQNPMHGPHPSTT